MQSNLRKRFDSLETQKRPYIEIAEKAAKLTLPYIFPEEGKENTALPQHWNNIGARIVNHLSAKLLLLLFPPTGGFFKYSLDEKIKAQLEKENPTAVRNADQYANTAERLTLQFLNQMQFRHKQFEAFKHDIITGNVALWFVNDTLKLYNLRDYVVQRDKSMNLVEVILRETVDYDTLPSKVQEFINENKIAPDTSRLIPDDTNPQYTIYTGAKLINGKWHMWQEIGDYEIPGTRKVLKKLPIIVLRWTDTLYGHGFIEQVLGNLMSIESLTKSITEGALIASKHVTIVRPSAETSLEEVAEAESGDVISGNPEDVGAIHADRVGDFQIAYQTLKDLELELKEMFLVFQPRQAERVTAEEIRRLAEEFETILGGVFTLLAEEFQRPLLELIFDNLKRKGDIAPPPDGHIQIILTSGFEALSRTAEFNKLLTMLQAISPIPDALQYVKWDDYLMRIVNALSINADGLIKSQDELRAEQEQMLQLQQQLQAQQQQQSQIQTQGGR